MTPDKIISGALGNLPKSKVKVTAQAKNTGIRGKLLGGKFDPKFVMVHHTAGTNSLSGLASGKLGGHAPVPGAHFLVAKDGTVTLLSVFQCYHAGKGKGFGVPENLMNPYAFGIEVESLGKVADFTAAQKASLGALISGLLDGMDAGTDKIINHKDWSSTGKVDTRYSKAEIAGWVKDYRKVSASTTGGYVTDGSYPRKKVNAAGQALIKDKDDAVETGQWVTLAEIDIPHVEGHRYLMTLQTSMYSSKLKDGEARLARVGWGADAAANGGEDYTGHNPIPARSAFGWWRTPIHHEMKGGGPVRFQVYVTGSAPKAPMKFVAKATRIEAS